MVSAVILSYNRADEVLKTINKLEDLKPALSFDLEIVVVDNASVDDTSAQVAQLHPDVVLVTKTKNNGIAGWNDGFKVASHRYFLVLDDDSHIISGLTEAIARLEANLDIGILALQITDEDQQHDPNLEPDDAWKDNQDICGFIGCGAIIRRQLYEKIGGYAEWIYVYTHEFEYGIRCLNAGYRINFFADGIVIHRVSKINRSNKRLRIFATRNELLIVHKYFRDNKLKYLLRVLVNNLKLMKREGVLTGFYILKGFWEFLKKRNDIVKSPVSDSTQRFFADTFWSTKPIFKKKHS